MDCSFSRTACPQFSQTKLHSAGLVGTLPLHLLLCFPPWHLFLVLSLEGDGICVAMLFLLCASFGDSEISVVLNKIQDFFFQSDGFVRSQEF